MDDLVAPDYPSSADPFPSLTSGDALPQAAAAASAAAGSVGNVFPPKPCLPTSKPVSVAPRADRYDTGVETRPLTPPASSNLELVFDSSKIFERHPRKYRLLLETDTETASSCKIAAKSGHPGTNGLSTATPSTLNPTTKGTPPAPAGQPGNVVAMGTTSSSPGADRTSLPTPAPVQGSPAVGAAAGGVDVVESTGPRRGSLALLEALSSFSVQGSKTKSTIQPSESAFSGDSRYVPQELLQSLKPRAVDSAPSTQPDPHPVDTRPADTRPALPVIHAPAAPDAHHTHSTLRMDSGGPSVPVAGDQGPFRAIQPEPRRLFGFGPYYRPLPEVVYVPPSADQGTARMGRRQTAPTLSVPEGLMDTVQREGLTGSRRASSFNVDAPDGGTAAPGTKKSPTPAELNAWLTGPF